jgi:hypothetical protein
MNRSRAITSGPKNRFFDYYGITPWDRHKVSHFAGRDGPRPLISSDLLGRMELVEFTEGERRFRRLGEGVVPLHGHPTFSPLRHRIACDSYSGREYWRKLMPYRVADGHKVSPGRFASPEPFSGYFRCHLDPRWRPNDRGVSFNSFQKGPRQVCVADVSSAEAPT